MKKQEKKHISNSTHPKHSLFMIFGSIIIFITGLLLIWIATLKTPDFKGFNDRVITNSTKIYDRTGEILLYDIYEDIKRIEIPFEDISMYAKNATVAIEDSEFYSHNGIRPKALLRAVFANLKTGEFSQGGSTITQQIVKNTLLTQNKQISRKLKEWVLALKVEKEFSKEQILEIYLNEAPYGGSMYGIQEASKTFFGIDAKDLTLAQSAYLAAIPNAPTFYSPYGKNREKLEDRKNLVLSRMVDLGFITEEEMVSAKEEVVEFLPKPEVGIEAPHFVFWVREYLEKTYGEQAVVRDGLIVKTTLDYDLQKKAEEVVAKHAKINSETYNASNAALVSINPQNGQVLSMVGSRNYFDEEIDGNFNVVTALRQPGSSFKPFIYATAMKEGFEPETVLFDVKTEFNTGCSPDGSQSESRGGKCYHPNNYDDEYVGPITLRNALAQSKNVVAVKLLYLVGIKDSISLAKNLGITSLNDPERYGLTLVLGGGEVQLLELTSAYGVFATEGIKHQPTGILEVSTQDGTILESFREQPSEVLDKSVAIKINSILSDNTARTPLWGSRSFMYHPGYDVAGKTGTTDNQVDAWMMGYSPNIVTGVWSGNNDNKPMKKGSAISGALWGEYMSYALPRTTKDSFTPLTETPPLSIKPILRGQWQGGESYIIDTISGGLATQYTPEETKKEILITNVHSILHWVNKENPAGEVPANPEDDNQYRNWEYAVTSWWNRNKHRYPQTNQNSIPSFEDTIHTLANKPTISFISPAAGTLVSLDQSLSISNNVTIPTQATIQKIDYFLNSSYLGTARGGVLTFTTTLNNETYPPGEYELKAIITDTFYNKGESVVQITITE